MGPTGAGKSSFINRIVGEERTQVGHKLVSCTYKIDIIRYRTQDDSQVVLIDTPGFNDTNLTDFAILVMITDWLAETYRRKVTLSGVLYFHRITDNRMTGSLQHNLDMFKSLVGFKAFSDVVLVTTMWDTVTDNLAKVNEQQLRTIYWREMLAKGSRLRRHDDTRESALSIISLFRASPHRTLLLVQHEMVNLNKALPDTTVGRRFIEWLSELLDRVKRRIFKRSRAKTLPPPGGSTGSPPGPLTDLEVMRETVLVEDIEERLNLKRKWISNLRGAITSSPLTASPRSSISIESADSPPSPVLALPSHSSISSYSSHDILQGTISWLRHVNTVTTAGQIPGLRELVGLALVVATTVDVRPDFLS
ncbi:P-loop containing nucleoside triphosphate hydrolase protein [Panaeolus papilionaceus]|nr:P-loop containing nucleoside triphosphate hydrolase protein [Panaeolus papilionaceus]